jgi:hypothetical protein
VRGLVGERADKVAMAREADVNDARVRAAALLRLRVELGHERECADGGAVEPDEERERVGRGEREQVGIAVGEGGGDGDGGEDGAGGRVQGGDVQSEAVQRLGEADGVDGVGGGDELGVDDEGAEGRFVSTTT